MARNLDLGKVFDITIQTNGGDYTETIGAAKQGGEGGGGKSPRGDAPEPSGGFLSPTQESLPSLSAGPPSSLRKSKSTTLEPSAFDRMMFKAELEAKASTHGRHSHNNHHNHHPEWAESTSSIPSIPALTLDSTHADLHDAHASGEGEAGGGKGEGEGEGEREEGGGEGGGEKEGEGEGGGSKLAKNKTVPLFLGEGKRKRRKSGVETYGVHKRKDAGKVVVNQFRIIGKLGSGSFGEVYKVRDTSTDHDHSATDNPEGGGDEAKAPKDGARASSSGSALSGDDVCCVYAMKVLPNTSLSHSVKPARAVARMNPRALAGRALRRGMPTGGSRRSGTDAKQHNAARLRALSARKRGERGTDPKTSSLSSLDLGPEADALYNDELGARHEIAVMKRLNHPNVVQLNEVMYEEPNRASSAGPLVYIVMEYLPGGISLDISLRKSLPSLDQAWAFFRDVAQGLDYLHVHHIIHRDLKPENLLLSSDGTVKISDFGVALVFDSSDVMSTASKGTPAFMAPELCASSDVKGRAVDIWALGCTLFSFVYGRLPFEPPAGGNPFAIQKKLFDSILSDPLVFPESPAISPDLRALLSGMLTKDPESRWSMDDITASPWMSRDGSDPVPRAEEEELVLLPSEVFAAAVKVKSMAAVSLSVMLGRRWLNSSRANLAQRESSSSPSLGVPSPSERRRSLPSEMSSSSGGIDSDDDDDDDSSLGDRDADPIPSSTNHPSAIVSIHAIQARKQRASITISAPNTSSRSLSDSDNEPSGSGDCGLGGDKRSPSLSSSTSSSSSSSSVYSTSSSSSASDAGDGGESGTK